MRIKKNIFLIPIFFFCFVIILTISACDSFNSNLELPKNNDSIDNEVIVKAEDLETEIVDLLQTYSEINQGLSKTAITTSVIKRINLIANISENQILINAPRLLEKTYLFRKTNQSGSVWSLIKYEPNSVNFFGDIPLENGIYQYLTISYFYVSGIKQPTVIYVGYSNSVNYQKTVINLPTISFPVNGCYIGYSAENMLPNEFLALVNKKPALTGIFIAFLESGQKKYPHSFLARLNQIKSAGSVPFITWEPFDSTNTDVSIMSEILNGSYDDIIDNWAEALVNYKYPIIIRFAHEMNGNWYPWSNDATLYKNVFRYVVNRFKAKGANNVNWCFAPNWENSSNRNFIDYYPGDEYVDSLGISGYNFGTTQPSWSIWREFSSIYTNMTIELTNLYNKPIIIDVGSVEEGGNKANWLTNMFNNLRNTIFRNIKAFVWFNYQKTEASVLTDWRIDSSSASLSSFMNGINDSYFISSPIIN